MYFKKRFENPFLFLIISILLVFSNASENGIASSFNLPFAVWLGSWDLSFGSTEIKKVNYYCMINIIKFPVVNYYL